MSKNKFPKVRSVSRNTFLTFFELALLYILIYNVEKLGGGKCMRELKIHGIYKHFKGDCYIVEGVRNT